MNAILIIGVIYISALALVCFWPEIEKLNRAFEIKSLIIFRKELKEGDKVLFMKRKYIVDRVYQYIGHVKLTNVENGRSTSALIDEIYPLTEN